MKRVLKDIIVEKLSNNENIITIQIFSDVGYLDKNFINMLLDPNQENKDTTNSKDENTVITEIRRNINKLINKYDVEILPEMGEHEIFSTQLSKEISVEIGNICISSMKPIVKKLVDEINNKVDKKNITTEELQTHLSNITRLIDLIKAHLAYIPNLRDRDKLMFQLLDDIKIYTVIGEKFTKLENFSTFWKLREEIAPPSNYNIGVKNKSQLPQSK